MIKYKDQITNVCGLLFAICGTMAAIPTLPESLRIACGTIAAIAGAVIGFLTGKTPPKPE